MRSISSAAARFDRAAVARDLFHRGIQHAYRLFGLEPRRVVVFGHEDGEEEGAEAALPGTLEVELAVRLTDADIAAVIEFAIDGVNVAVEDQ